MVSKTDYKYPLSTSTWNHEEIEAIENVIQSNRFTMGQKVEDFENEFAKFFSSKYCVMVNSGSSANLLMISALMYSKNNKYKLNEGDEIIVPAIAWSTSYFPLFQNRLKLKFVDVDLHTLNYDLERLEKSISNKTKFIFAVNLLGNSNDFLKINQIIANSKNPNIQIIEDNCESMGAKVNKKNAGTFGIMSTFSSFYSHHICTIEGGMILTSDKELYHILLSLRAHGWTRDLPDKNLVTGNKSKNKFDESWNFVLPGYNVRPIEFEGAIGSIQLRKFPNFLKIRRQNAKYFQEIFGSSDDFIIQEEIGESSWFAFSIIIKNKTKFNRDDIINRLENNGIEHRPIASGNFTKNDVVNFFNYEIFDSLENSKYIDKNGFMISNQPYDIREFILTAYNVIKN
jgi:CDP-4-dehydro-6-deoxyglucose reductase, E1